MMFSSGENTFFTPILVAVCGHEHHDALGTAR